jgi:hypothetical protein
MTQSQMPSLIDELLGRRREYFAHVELTRTTGHPAACGVLPLNETDYTLIWYLLTRLRIGALHVDNGAIAGLFRAAAPPAGMRPVTVLILGGGVLEIAAPLRAGFGSLVLFGPANRSAAESIAAAVAKDSLALCYGVTGTIDTPFAETLLAVSRGCGEQVFVPLSSLAPPLWRATSILIARGSRRTFLTEVVRQLTETFCGEDLDALRLAEENLALRSSHGALDEMKAHIATLETQVASLRRAALAQEETIAELSHSQTGSRTTENGRLPVGRR